MDGRRWCSRRSRARFVRLIGGQHRGIELGRGPHRERLIGEPPGALLDGRLVPCVELAEPGVEPERAFLEAACHVALLDEGAVAVFGVVASEREVAERVQPLLLDTLPLRAEVLLPCCREVGVLRHDVLDSVFVDRHALLATVVLQSTQPVASASEVVEIAGLKVAPELVVAGEAAIRRQQ